jgi:hypothetical protein
LLKCSERWKRKEELLNSISPRISEEIAIRKIPIVRNTTKQRNLSTLAYNNNCKWENQTTKGELRLQKSQNVAVCNSERL